MRKAKRAWRRSDFLHEEVCSGLEDAIRIREKWSEPFKLEILGLFRTGNEGASSYFSIQRAKARSVYEASTLLGRLTLHGAVGVDLCRWLFANVGLPLNP